MINFRYHVVSIVAVFLALAIGIVLGSTELQGTAIDVLQKTSNQVKSEYDNAHAQDVLLQQQVNGAEAFAQADEARLLDGLLDGQRVVLVTAPGAPGTVVSGMMSALRQAGATVTGQVSLQPKLLDASANNQQFLSSLVQTLVQSGSGLSNGTPLQQAAELLGSAILTKDNPAGGTTDPAGNQSGDTGKQSSNGQEVLASYAQAGLLSISGQPSVPATLAMVITPSTPPAGGDSDPANQSLITLAQGLNMAGLGTVMAGSISGSVSGSAIDALRGSTAAGQISSVDDADMVSGQIVTVQALALALTGHKAGSYGVGPGNNGAAPSPAPTPSASVTPTTTTGSQGKSTKTSASGKKPSKGKA